VTPHIQFSLSPPSLRRPAAAIILCLHSYPASRPHSFLSTFLCLVYCCGVGLRALKEPLEASKGMHFPACFQTHAMDSCCGRAYCVPPLLLDRQPGPEQRLDTKPLRAARLRLALFTPFMLLRSVASRQFLSWHVYVVVHGCCLRASPAGGLRGSETRKPTGLHSALCGSACAPQVL